MYISHTLYAHVVCHARPHACAQIENVLISSDGTLKLCDFGSTTTQSVHFVWCSFITCAAAAHVMSWHAMSCHVLSMPMCTCCWCVFSVQAYTTKEEICFEEEKISKYSTSMYRSVTCTHLSWHDGTRTWTCIRPKPVGSTHTPALMPRISQCTGDGRSVQARSD